jgi:predicted kinase
VSKIILLKGLPASGKSTYAKELVNRGGWKRVNKDDLRSMLDDSKWSKGNEKMVLRVRNAIIEEALTGLNNSVVVDDTNFAPSHEFTMRDIADRFKIPFEIKFFDVSPEECIKRDLKRPNSVGSDVIWQMYNQYLKPAPEVYTPPKDGRKAIICDIDGTLAHMDGRGPFEWERVGEDTLDETVANILRHYNARDLMDDESEYAIIMLSGRDGVCRPETMQWLSDNNIYYDHLYMREAGDMRKDSIIKRELFDKHIHDTFNVQFVLDDRNQVVQMWRDMGLKVLQVADGNF